MSERCRHRTVWILASGGRRAWLWCWRCGALRREGWPKWVKPTDARGVIWPEPKNPALTDAWLKQSAIWEA